MARISKSIEIRVPPEEVWEMLVLDRLQEWQEESQENLKSVEYISEVNTPKDKYRVGAIARVTDNSGKQSFLEITESLENKKMTYRGPGHVSKSLVETALLEAVEEGTKITWVCDYEMPLGILGKFLDNVYVQEQAERTIASKLENLKSILEE